ncbi:MAG: glycerophosphodiester phosphodiesterase [Blastocatellales bacterium]
MLIIAHRGASRAEPENTLRAFDLAIRQGAQMIELDLHLTADGHVVVIHDPELDHTTDLTGRVDQLTLDQVRRADAGKGERIPTLDETLDLTLGRVRLYLEIKDPRAAEETLRMIRARNCRDACLLASFDLPLMRRLGREVNDIELGVILGNETINPVVRWREAFPWLALRDIRYDVLCMQVELCYGMLVRKMKASGRKVYVWTADEDKQFERMIGYEVDGIVTNVPDRLNNYLSKRGITPC